VAFFIIYKNNRPFAEKINKDFYQYVFTKAALPPAISRLQPHQFVFVELKMIYHTA